MRTHRDPETKEDFLDRLLMADYNGDIRQIGGAPAKIKRLAPHMLRLEFEDGGIFDLTVHKPRKPEIAEQRETRTFRGEEWTVEPASQPQRPRKRRASPTRPASGNRDARG